MNEFWLSVVLTVVPTLSSSVAIVSPGLPWWAKVMIVAINEAIVWVYGCPLAAGDLIVN